MISIKEMEKTMRKIFNDSQRVHKQEGVVQQLSKLQKTSNTDSFLKKFYIELIRNIKITLNLEYRSHFTLNSIDFIIKYLLTFSSNEENYYSPENESNITLIDTVLKDVINPYLYNPKVECRINACNFIRKLFDELEDINEDTYKEVKKCLLERCADKTSSVRSYAFLALHRFQDLSSQNDIAIKAIQFHLNNDPDSEVRHNCLKTIAPSKTTLSDFIHATRDVKDFIRKTAFIQIADKLQIKCFTIEQRLTILKNGLKDRSPIVRKVVESVLIPSWVKSCDNDLIQLLIALDIQTDLVLIEQMLEIYFKQLNKEKISKESSKTKFQVLIEDFRNQYLTEDRIFKVALNVENVFLWRYLSEFCKNNQIVAQNIEKTAQQESIEEEEVPENQILNEEISPEESGETSASNVDLVDLLLPDIPYYCDFLKKFVQNVISQELDIEDAMDFEFIYLQIMKISLLFDIEDEAQRKKMIETMRYILMDNQIGDKFHSYISPVMKRLSKSGFANKSEYLDFTIGIIADIYASFASSSDESDSIAEEFKELEEKNERLTIEMNKYKEELHESETEKRFSDAENVKENINRIQLEIDQLKDKMSNNTSSQNSQSSQRSLPSFLDYPKHLLRCLHIFSGCLEFGEFNEVNAVMQTHIEKVCLPGFLSEDEKIRIVATKCLGLVGLISPQYFKKYLHLLIEVFLKDVESIKLVALKSIFDSLCEHGINIFEEKPEDKTMREDRNESLNENPIECSAFEDNDEDFITSLKHFFDTQLDSESDEIKFVTAQGIAKLLILGRMYSSLLLSKLIIIWFNPEEKQTLLQFIGDFLRIYAFAESQGVIVGQSALEEAFVITLKTVYENSISYLTHSLDTLIKFFLNLIVEESHVKLIIQLVKEMVDCDSKLAEEYLLPALTQLNFIEIDSKELESLEKDFAKIENKFENSKSKTAKSIAIIKEKIEIRKQQLKAVISFADDFAPIDDNEDNEDVNEIEDQKSNSINEKQFRRSISPSNSDKNDVKRRKTENGMIYAENDNKTECETNESEMALNEESNENIQINSTEVENQILIDNENEGIDMEIN